MGLHIPMIPLLDASEMEVADDCEHLTEKGHRQIAELFYKKIVESYINGGEQTNV